MQCFRFSQKFSFFTGAYQSQGKTSSTQIKPLSYKDHNQTTDLPLIHTSKGYTNKTTLEYMTNNSQKENEPKDQSYLVVPKKIKVQLRG